MKPSTRKIMNSAKISGSLYSKKGVGRSAGIRKQIAQVAKVERKLFGRKAASKRYAAGHTRSIAGRLRTGT